MLQSLIRKEVKETYEPVFWLDRLLLRKSNGDCYEVDETTPTIPEAYVGHMRGCVLDQSVPETVNPDLETMIQTLIRTEFAAARKAEKAEKAAAKAAKAEKAAAARVAMGRMNPDDINEELCQARKLPDALPGYKPIVYRETQCTKPKKTDDLCGSCHKALEKAIELGDEFVCHKTGHPKWLGLITEEPLPSCHMLGTAWAEKKVSKVEADVAAPLENVVVASPVAASPLAKRDATGKPNVARYSSGVLNPEKCLARKCKQPSAEEKNDWKPQVYYSEQCGADVVFGDLCQKCCDNRSSALSNPKAYSGWQNLITEDPPSWSCAAGGRPTKWVAPV